MIRKLKTMYLRACYSVAFLPPFRGALYTRAIAPRWPFQQTLEQMNTLSQLLLGVDSPGAYWEVGCAEGWTTIWQHRAMREAGIARRMFVVDTFHGFTPDDKAAEAARGKSAAEYDGLFSINSKRWFEESMRRAAVPVEAFKADAAVFDYSSLPPPAFVFLDVDLYRPVKEALRRIWPLVPAGGLVVVDDCQPHKLWDGALQAYDEFCRENAQPRQIVAQKFGMLRKG